MYRLLIADDEESIREGVADFVRQNCPEWDVAALARDGREALALAREILPDAVLTDITMPHMNGLEFLESLSDLLPEAKLLVRFCTDCCQRRLGSRNRTSSHLC